MKFRFTLACLALAALFSYTGCDKVKKILHRAPKNVAALVTPTPATPTPGTPTPTATVSATPTPTPKITANHDASVIVLCFHRFEDNVKSSMSTKPADFEKEMQALKDNGFTVISMQDFLAWRRDEKPIPAKSALITIDDGYVSAYDNAWPILKKFGYPFTEFVYIKYVNSGGKSISWDQLAEMRDAGVEIGCHSYTHQNLRCRTSKAKADAQRLGGVDQWLHHEIADSKKVIEDKLGVKVSVFAYPEGAYDEKVVQAVKDAGYEAAFVTYGQRNTFSAPDIELVGRYAIESNKPKTFTDALAMIGGGMGLGSAMVVSAPVTTNAAAPAVSPIQPTPAEGATVSNPKPLIKAVLTGMGTLDADSVQMRISGFGLVPAKYDAATQTISYKPARQSLRDKEYTVIISGKVNGKRTEARWSFKFDPSAKK